MTSSGATVFSISQDGGVEALPNFGRFTTLLYVCHVSINNPYIFVWSRIRRSCPRKARKTSNDVSFLFTLKPFAALLASRQLVERCKNRSCKQPARLIIEASFKLRLSFDLERGSNSPTVDRNFQEVINQRSALHTDGQPVATLHQSSSRDWHKSIVSTRNVYS